MKEGIGINSRNRMERINTRNPFVLYGLGQDDLSFRHCTYELVSEQIISQYEKANQRLQTRRNVYD